MFKKFALLIVVAVASGCAHTPSAVMESYGFKSLALAASGYEPGEIYYSTKGSNGILVTPICTVDEINTMIGKKERNASSLNSVMRRGFTFTDLQLDKLGLKFSAKYVKEFTLIFNNAKTYYIPLSKSHAIYRNISGDCLAAIMDAKLNDLKPQIIAAVFVADGEYKIDYKESGITGKLSKSIKNELSLEFGIQFTGVRTTSGKGLVYGVKSWPVNTKFLK